MIRFETLFPKYSRMVLFDTETTGLQYARDEIIEFAAVVVEPVDGVPAVVRTYDELIALTPENTVPPMIQDLTGITDRDLLERGLPKEHVAADIAEMFEGNTLLIAYNAHFDLSFLYYFLLRAGKATALKGKDKMDLLTVYRDRRPYPHKLCNAIEAYGLKGQVVNSHRAVDDVLATFEVMKQMAFERDDLENYINLFGYHPRFGIDGKPIGSITYKPQSMEPTGIPLYRK